MKTFNTNFGTFILNDNILSMNGSDKTVNIKEPESLNESRLFDIWNVIWNDSVEEKSIDELHKIVSGMQAINPKAFV